MEANTSNRGERRAEWLLIAMAAGIVGITALVWALAVVGEWWFLAVTMATLLGCAGGVVSLILRLLERPGDAVPVARTAPSPSGAGRSDAARPRGRRPAATTPALGGA